MSKVVAWCTGVVLAGAIAVCVPSAAAQSAGSWGRAIGVPGLAALNLGGSASVTTMSCPSAGNCAVSGYYSDRHEKSQGFVAAERNGRWGTAIELPGLSALNKGEFAKVDEVSCGSAGNCAIGGYYSGSRSQQGFVALERDGRWGKAIGVPGLAALNKGQTAEVNSVSCGSASNCVAGGYYSFGPIGQRGFVAVERNGRWDKATEVPGLGALNKGGFAEVESVSCSSPGNCAAGGQYSNGPGGVDVREFAVSERNGRWGKVIDVPGLATLNTGQGAEIDSVSCSPAGNCAAGGCYMHAAAPPFFSQTQAFVVSRSS